MRLRVVVEVGLPGLEAIVSLVGEASVRDVYLVPADGAAQTNESLFVSFSSEKGSSSLPIPAAPAPDVAAAKSRGTWLTPERKDVLRARWPTEMAARDIHAEMTALPGPALPPISRLAIKASSMGMRRPTGFLVARPPAAWKTPEREQRVRALWEARKPLGEIWGAVRAVPGPHLPATPGSLQTWIKEMGLEARPRGRGRVPELARFENSTLEVTRLSEEFLAEVSALCVAGKIEAAARICHERVGEDEALAVPDALPAPERVERRCLNCSKAFMAPGRFIRLCGYCRQNASGVAA
jgi:hypothetical protein